MKKGHWRFCNCNECCIQRRERNRRAGWGNPNAIQGPVVPPAPWEEEPSHVKTPIFPKPYLAVENGKLVPFPKNHPSMQEQIQQMEALKSLSRTTLPYIVITP